jgi:Tfp pilus assembly protein PilO
MPVNTKLTRSRRFLIVGGYGALLLTVALVGAVHVRGMISARSAIAAARHQIDETLRKKGELADVEKRVELLKRQVANYPRLVPENKEVGDFLVSLTNQFSSVGMKDIAYKSLASIELGKTQKLPIELKGCGTFNQFHEFLVQLEHLQRMSSVGRLDVESDPDMTGKVTVDLLLYIYNTKPG